MRLTSSDRGRHPSFDPTDDVGEHRLAAGVVEQVVIVPLVQLERLVLRCRRVEELLTPTRFRRLIGRAVQDQYGQRDQRELSRQTIIRARELCDGLSRLRLVRNERICVALDREPDGGRQARRVEAGRRGITAFPGRPGDVRRRRARARLLRGGGCRERRRREEDDGRATERSHPDSPKEESEKLRTR